jgi:hypothetical protein
MERVYQAATARGERFPLLLVAAVKSRNRIFVMAITASGEQLAQNRQAQLCAHPAVRYDTIMKKLRSPLPDEYVVELLSEHGDCDRIIGWGPDLGAAHQCYHETARKCLHTAVRLRQGTQAIALRIPSSFLPASRKH